MNDNWALFTEIDFADESIMQYHIDTRDFCCFANKEKQDKHKFDFSTVLKYGDRFFYTPTDVKQIIERLYIESGGLQKTNWRCLMLENYKYWLKYIRIYRTEHGLIICDRDSKMLNRETITSAVIQDVLH